jgi:hypothetical protein
MAGFQAQAEVLSPPESPSPPPPSGLTANGNASLDRATTVSVNKSAAATGYRGACDWHHRTSTDPVEGAQGNTNKKTPTTTIKEGT